MAGVTRKKPNANPKEKQINTAGIYANNARASLSSSPGLINAHI